MPTSDLERANYETFRECLSNPVIQASIDSKPKTSRARKQRKTKTEEGQDDDDDTAQDLAEFIDVIL